jgi:hypothetical protein
MTHLPGSSIAAPRRLRVCGLANNLAATLPNGSSSWRMRITSAEHHANSPKICISIVAHFSEGDLSELLRTSHYLSDLPRCVMKYITRDDRLHFSGYQDDDPDISPS